MGGSEVRAKSLLSICVGVAGSKAQFKRHGGASRGGDRNRNGEKGRESLDIIEGDNLRRQMGRNEGLGRTDGQQR